MLDKALADSGLAVSPSVSAGVGGSSKEAEKIGSEKAEKIGS